MRGCTLHSICLEYMCQFGLQCIAQTLLVPNTFRFHSKYPVFGGSVISILARNLTYVSHMNSWSLSSYTLQFHRAVQAPDDLQQIPKHLFRINAGDVSRLSQLILGNRPAVGDTWYNTTMS